MWTSLKQIGDACCKPLIKAGCLALVYKLFFDSIYRKGAAADNVWGFLDATACPICRTKVQQGILYNVYKGFHVLKSQSVTTPSGMIANLNDPVEGRRHDCAWLSMLNILQKLRQFSYGVNVQVLFYLGILIIP